MDARNTGTLIRALREERGLTQRQLADVYKRQPSVIRAGEDSPKLARVRLRRSKRNTNPGLFRV